MNSDMKTVKALSDFRLEVEFQDGRRGVFDLKPHLAHRGLSALREPQYFARVATLFGAVTWPSGEDISPETLAAELQALQATQHCSPGRPI